jgi:hypothetical protein
MCHFGHSVHAGDETDTQRTQRPSHRENLRRKLKERHESLDPIELSERVEEELKALIDLIRRTATPLPAAA